MATLINGTNLGDGGGGGGDTPTLQEVYNASSEPEIITTSGQNAVCVQRGTASDTDSVLCVQNGAGTNTFSISGNGSATTGTLNASGQITVDSPTAVSAILKRSGGSDQNTVLEFEGGTGDVYVGKTSTNDFGISTGANVSAGAFRVEADTGNIVAVGTVDGRNVSTDGTKLDGIETGANVTDTTNVTSSGAAMRSANLSNMASASTSLSNIGGIGASTTNTLTNKTFDVNGTGNNLSNVGVSDLANGTDGELITWNASGVPATVAVGTTDQVLTSNGAGNAPTFKNLAAGSPFKGFSAKRTSTFTQATSGVDQILIFNSEKYDTEGWYNTSTGVFQPTEAGYYSIRINVALKQFGERHGTAGITLNGTFVMGAILHRGYTTTTSDTACVEVILHLNGTTDTVDVRSSHQQQFRSMVPFRLWE